MSYFSSQTNKCKDSDFSRECNIKISVKCVSIYLKMFM